MGAWGLELMKLFPVTAADHELSAFVELTVGLGLPRTAGPPLGQGQGREGRGRVGGRMAEHFLPGVFLGGSAATS